MEQTSVFVDSGICLSLPPTHLGLTCGLHSCTCVLSVILIALKKKKANEGHSARLFFNLDKFMPLFGPRERKWSLCLSHIFLLEHYCPLGLPFTFPVSLPMLGWTEVGDADLAASVRVGSKPRTQQCLKHTGCFQL